MLDAVFGLSMISLVGTPLEIAVLCNFLRIGMLISQIDYLLTLSYLLWCPHFCDNLLWLKLANR